MSSDSILPMLGGDALAATRMSEQTKKLEQLKTQAAGASDKNTADMEKAAVQFEGLLVKEMLKSMWNTVPQGGMLTGSKEENLYRDMLNDAYADEISSGQGIGIKELILREFERK